MNKRKRKINLQDAADILDVSVYVVEDNAQYYNEFTAKELYEDDDMSYFIDAHIVHHCKETINTMLPLL